MGLDELLNNKGFIEHPFNTWIAEDEKRLQAWFVAPPFLKTIIGYGHQKKKALKPSSSIVFGKPGSGKTALRLMMERDLASNASDDLVLRYIDFNTPISLSNTPALSAHIEEIIRLGTVGLIRVWNNNPDKYKKLNLIEKAELAGLVYHYYENLPPASKRLYAYNLSPIVSRATGVAKIGWSALLNAYNATIGILKTEKIEPADWSSNNKAGKPYEDPYLRLERFWYLAQSMGINNIWVLVDGIDEASGVNSCENIFNCIFEILLSQRILEFRQDNRQCICFKFFLTNPEELIPMLDNSNFRKDRVKVKLIEWERSDLDSALKNRLAFFSNDRVLSFDDLCDQDAKGAHALLLDKCQLRPRTLFRMTHEIFSEIEKKDQKKQILIDKQSVDIGIESGLKATFG